MGKIGKEFLYNIGDVVNDSLIIVKQTRENKRKEKSYVVQSLMYPEAPVYIVTEGNLKLGRGDAYATNRKVFEGNSLWSREEYRKYIVDIEEAKTIAPSANKKIRVVCPDCKTEKMIVVSNIISRDGISCNTCNNYMVEYRYKKGDEINGLKIINQTKKEYKGIKYKSYEVQSLTYPKAPIYIVKENDLKSGIGDAYKSGKRICEENSLYSVEEIRGNIVDIKLSKKTAKHSNVKMMFKCSDCGRKKEMLPGNLVKNGFACPVCSSGKSFNEILFMCYQEYFKLNYQSEKILKELPNRRFDFVNIEKRTIVECNGIGHYEDSGFLSHSKSLVSDMEKRDFAKKNGFLLIELDCRKNSFKGFVDSVNKCKHLPSIYKKDEEAILQIIESSKRYPLKEILDMYNEGFSCPQIGKILNLHHSLVANILKKSGVNLRQSAEYTMKAVRCINNGKVFKSIADATKYAGIRSTSGIGDACKNKTKSAGKLNGQKLYWEYVEEGH